MSFSGEAGSKVTDWVESRIGDAGIVQTGSTPPTSDRSLYGREFMFVSPADMGSNKYIQRSQKMLSAKGFAGSRRFPAGSVLFVCIGSTIGKTGLALVELTSNQQITAVTARPGVDAEFLYYALAKVAEVVKSQAGEQAVPLVNKSDFSNFKIHLPGLAEQLIIAEALRDSDDLISSLERLITKKRAIKQGVMQQLLTGKTRLPHFYGKWTDLGFDEVLVTVNTRHSQVDTAEYRAIGVLPVVDQSKNFIAGYVNGETRPITPDADGFLVFGDHTCTTKFVDFAFVAGADGTKVLRSRRPSVISIRFAAYLLELNPLQSTGYNRHFSKLRERAFRFPPLPEQVAISEVLADIDAEIGGLISQLAAVRGIKQGMAQELISGRTRLKSAEVAA